VVDKVGKFVAPVNVFARRRDALGQRSWTATEHADFANVAVLALHKLEERGQVGTTEVVHCLQTGEHGRVGQSLEVVLADVLKKGQN